MSLLVFDPNVFVSAFISPRRSAPALLVEAFLDGRVQVLVCACLIDEFAGVLARPKFARHSGDGRARDFVATISDHAIEVGDPVMAAGVTADPDDDYLIALARAHDAQAVVSGDRHLLDATDVGVGVWSPRAAVGHLGLDT